MGLGIYFMANAAKLTGRAFHWWHWLMAIVSGILWITSFAWLGSQLGEGTTRGGLIGFALIIAVSIIIAVLTWRLLPSRTISEAK